MSKGPSMKGWMRHTHGVHTDHHKGGPSLQPKKGDSAPKHDPAPVKHHKPDAKEYAKR